MIHPYPAVSQPVTVGCYPPSGYDSGGSQYGQYPQGYVQPRDPRASDPIPVSPGSSPPVDGSARYEPGDQLRHGSPSPPTYLSIPK
jgi:hypothetical protein